MNKYREKQSIDPVILDAGDVFFSSGVLAAQNADGDKIQAKGLLQGYEKIGCDALNIGGFDLAAGKDFLLSLSSGTTIPFISANLTDLEDNLLFQPYRIIEKNGFNIGVVGVSNHIPEHILDVGKRPYVETANQVIDELKPQVDFVVLLANIQRKQVNNLAQNIPNADYIFISRDTKRTRSELKQAEHGPYIYSSGIQGKYLTVVEIALQDSNEPITDISEAKGKITSINKRMKKLQEKDPAQSLEEIYAEKPKFLKLISTYRQQIIKYETVMANAVNTTIYESIALDKNVGEDKELLAFVDETLATCNALRKKPIKASKKIFKPKSGPIKKKISIN